MEGNKTEIVEIIRTLLADALKVGVDDIAPDAAFGDLPQWDSMGHMEVLLVLEQHFGVEVSAETIGGLTSIPLISAHIMGQNNG